MIETDLQEIKSTLKSIDESLRVLIGIEQRGEEDESKIRRRNKKTERKE